MTIDPARRETLLVEYQKAQDSAEHHDNAVGTVTSLWIGSAVLIGFVLSGSSSTELVHHKTVLYLIAVFGMGLTVLAGIWAADSSKLKVQKYQRCKDIEAELGMSQHTAVGPSKPWETCLYNALLLLLFAVWVVLVIEVARTHAPHHH